MTDSYHHDGDGTHQDVDVDKDINTDVSLDYNTDVSVDTDVSLQVCSFVNVDGNAANINFDAEAFGSDTLVQVDVNALTIEDQLSSAIGSITSAAG